MRKCTRESGDYNECRKISNARFDYEPDIIYYCESVDDVKTAVKAASKAKDTPVRIRSGGHQHEGMCSGNGALIIDVTELHDIRFNGDRAWIGAGARLGSEKKKDKGTVYYRMREQGLLFPGGGCGDVRVGGLVQGGGWGLLTRRRGLTCDALIGFRMITASGDEIEVLPDSKDHGDLHWALCGGGGGNFGVVTEFLFDLERRQTAPSSFTWQWKESCDVHDVLTEWGENFPRHKDNRLTTYCRITVMGKHPNEGDRPIIVGGSFLGDGDEMESLLKKLLPKTHKRREPDGLFFSDMFGGFSDYQPGPPIEAIRALPQYAGLEVEPPSETCAAGASFPHKVSSCFPKGDGKKMSPDLIKAITRIFSKAKSLPGARLYLSLHCLGGQVGKINGDRSCFAFRKKPVILQSQAWWVVDPQKRDPEAQAIAWIRKVAKKLDKHTEGAFINFPDRDLVRKPDTPAGRQKLLRKYYGENLERLIGVKACYDKHNLFDFEMGIPTTMG